MNELTQIPEIGAEMLLNYLYPELEERWTARHDGTFYRNYNRDILSLEPEEESVSLSRDGFLALLPQGLLSPEEELKKGDRQDKHKALEERIKVLSEAFLPIDTFRFRRQLKAEREVSELLDGKLEYILKTYFGFDLAAEQNPYVREFAVLLPCIRQRRGDFGLVRNLLSAVFHCEVQFSQRRYSGTDSTRSWLPVARYELLIPGLSAGEVQALYNDLQPLTAFLGEWFIPMEVRLEIVIRQHGSGPELKEGLTLDYNTEI
ncbi:MAG: hypothetical protein IKX62_00800 [Bacteroidales bacterium]|nr:hypothetical protein [Bacteroidales bacterium]